MVASAESPRVGVVGAGLAGLTAARHLASEGRGVVVYDARPQVGGRAQAFRDGLEGDQHADLGPELVTAGYRALSRLCAELGVEMAEPISFDRPDTAPEETAVEAMLGAGRLILDGKVIGEERAGELRAEIRSAVEDASPRPYEVLAQWVRRARLSPGAATAVIAVGSMMSGDPAHFDGHHPLGPAWGAVRRIHGGVPRLAEVLAAGLDLRLSTPIRAIRQGGGASLVTEAGETERFDQIIVTVPVHVVPTIGFEPPLEAQRLAALGSFPAALGGKVVAQYAEGEDVRAALARACFTDGAVHALWVSNPEVEDGPAVVTGFVTGRHIPLLDAPEEALARLDEIVALAVGSSVTRIAGTAKNWGADRWALAATTTPGDSQRGEAVPRVSRAANRVHFAGDYTDFWWSGTMEGAVRSGLRAAAEVLRRPVRVSPSEVDAWRVGG